MFQPLDSSFGVVLGGLVSDISSRRVGFEKSPQGKKGEERLLSFGGEKWFDD